MRYVIHVYVGDRFGKWVITNTDKLQSDGLVTCACDCGTVSEVSAHNLKYGYSTGCGCGDSDPRHAPVAMHGLSGTRLYRVWSSIVARCCNENNQAYPRYGGRGIKLCQEWRNSYPAFREWALSTGYDENAPRGKCTLDRIDVDGDYCPENCRWVDMRAQSNNTRQNVRLSYKGESWTIAELARKCGLSTQALYRRLKQGWKVEDALELPLGESPSYIKHGTRMRPVNLINENGEIIETFPGIVVAAEETGCPTYGIGNVCRGWQESTKGMMFEYADEHGTEKKKPIPVRPPKHDGHLICVDMYSKDGEYLMTFPSIKAATAYVGKTSSSAIGQCCMGKAKSAYGYVWRYSDTSGSKSSKGHREDAPNC